MSFSSLPKHDTRKNRAESYSKEILKYFVDNRVRYFRGRVTNFYQSEARKQSFLASDWLKFVTLPRKYRTLNRNDIQLDADHVVTNVWIVAV